MAKALVPSAEEVAGNAAVDAGGKTPALALEWLLDEAQAASEATGDKVQCQSSVKQAEGYIDRLCIADPIRKKYWQYRLVNLRKISSR